MDYPEKRRLLRQLEHLYQTDPQFKKWVDEMVEKDLEKVFERAQESLPIRFDQ